MTVRDSPALKGVLAAVAGLAVTELLAGIMTLRVSTVVALGETVIDLTPGPVAHTIISVVGHLDKPLAIAGVVLGILGLGAVVGHFWPTRRWVALTGIIVLVILAMAAVASRPDLGAAALIACVLGGIVTTTVLDGLNWERPGRSADESRRAFLRNAALIGVGAAIAVTIGRVVGHTRTVVEQARSRLRLPTRRLATPSGADLGLPRLEPWRTPNDEFYRIDTALSVPLIEPDEWRLRIHGMVDNEMTLTFQDLLDRGLDEAWVTLCCVSNEVGGNLIGNAAWSGVSIKAILDEAGVQPAADALKSTSEDGWTCGTPLAALTDGRTALLAVAMDGVPLPIEHGFPVRQVVPGLYGYVSATKWVTDWEITRFEDFTAYWTERGWGAKGPVKTQSRIDVPDGRVDAGVVKVAGTAWAQHRGIEAVEVRVDGGTWHQATLAKVPNIDTWVQWVWAWDAQPGEHTLEVRATDATGVPQTAERADVLPDGATGYHRTSVSVG